MPRLPLLLPRELDDSSRWDDDPLIPSLERLDEPLIPSLERLDEPLKPSLERLDEPLRPSLERLDEPLMPSSVRDVARSLSLDDDPLDEALRPSEPERSCDLPRPELVLPDAPRPSLRVLLSPTLLELRSLPPAFRLLLSAAL